MTNTIDKVLRFSELTPNRIAKLNEFAVHVPNVAVSFVFRRITNGMWVFQTDSAVPVYLPDSSEVNPPHLMSDEEVSMGYCGLVLTLCRLVGVTYDDVRITYQWAPRMVKEEK